MLGSLYKVRQIRKKKRDATGSVASLARWDSGSIPGLAQWAKDHFCSCGMDHNCCSDPWARKYTYHRVAKTEKKKRKEGDTVKNKIPVPPSLQILFEVTNPRGVECKLFRNFP